MTVPEIHVLCALRDSASPPLQRDPDGVCSPRFAAEPGLYQLSVIADAADFDWESLYIDLSKFHNKGQRTGPWDFDVVNQNKPLVPSYWVEVDGQRLGLWYFQRVSLQDIEARRFRGRMAFRLAQAGEHELRLTPYRETRVRWISAKLETDPEDQWAPLPKGILDAEGNVPMAQWADPRFWDEQRQRLETTHAAFREPLQRAFDWVCGREQDVAAEIPLLLAAHDLAGRPEALPRALEAIDAAVAAPSWNGAREDSYGYNGDMGAATVMRALAWAFHALGDRLDGTRRGRLLDKLKRQGNAFLDLALLNRDYWGGSLIQDHGWVSMFGFGAAALHLLGVIPDARDWVSYALGRLEQSMDAMPLDGAMPASSYFSAHRYLEDPTHYRQALLALTGEDIFDRQQFRRIVPFVRAVLNEEDHALHVTGQGDRIPLVGGIAFFNAMAAKYADADAARLARCALECPPVSFYHSSQERAFYHSALWGMLSHDPGVPASQAPAPRRRHLVHFQDVGMAHYRDDDAGVALSLLCGPWAGYNGHRKAHSPCDTLASAPGAGHFTLFLNSVPMLVTPDSGYRLRSFLRTCLLIDGKGQHGDVGYPMSIPSTRHRGERIAGVHWDADAGTGRIVLDLKPAYPDELDLLAYTREFLFAPERRIICRDHVAMGTPHHLSWLFHGSRKTGVRLERGLRTRIGDDPALCIAPRTEDLRLRASVNETEVVWSYASANAFTPFDHVRYDTADAVACALAEFVMTW